MWRRLKAHPLFLSFVLVENVKVFFLKFLVQVPVPQFNSVFLLPFLTLQTFNLAEREGEWLFLSHLLWQRMGDGGLDSYIQNTYK